ncbi:hypothetical protein D9M68_651030 [compost metagenome]
MNNQAPIEHPERTHAYQEGAGYRRHGLGREACPWGMGDMKQRHLFLAGWHDMDIALGEGSKS